MSYIYKTRPINIEGYVEINEGYYVTFAQYADGEEEVLSDEETSEVESMFQTELYNEACIKMASHAFDLAKDARKYGDS